MRIESISADRENLYFHMDDAVCGTFTLVEYAPTMHAEADTILSAQTLEAADVLCIPRFDGARDRLTSRFVLLQGGRAVPGVSFVTELPEEIAENRHPYPQASSRKALRTIPEDVAVLGHGQTVLNISIYNIMQTTAADAIVFPVDGVDYYFNRAAVENIDRRMQEDAALGLVTTLILLNSPKFAFGQKIDPALPPILLHPNFDTTFPDAHISAFNMRTVEAQGYFRAFVEFVVNRYSRDDKKYGVAAGLILNNEIDRTYDWGNAGEMPMQTYVAEYLTALRLAWQSARKHTASFRVYLSLCHDWNGHTEVIPNPLRYYKGKEIVEELNARACETGNFPWNVAYHCYPEDLGWCDFWHDRMASFKFSTHVISYKNMEVLEAFLAQEHLLYKGQPRRIVFSENGFGTQQDEFKDLTERWAAAGYTLAFLKMRKMKTVDMFFHHNYVDNPNEFGLNLGIRRHKPLDPAEVSGKNFLPGFRLQPGEPKPTYYAIADMETEREEARVQWAKEVIGEELFELILNPVIRPE